MRRVRAGVEPRAGVLDGDAVSEFAAAGTLGDLLALPLNRIRDSCADPGGATLPVRDVELLAPVDGRMEVWAAGVTYGGRSTHGWRKASGRPTSTSSSTTPSGPSCSSSPRPGG